jgi:hypothetical protein
MFGLVDSRLGRVSSQPSFVSGDQQQQPESPLDRAIKRYDRAKWQQARNTALGQDPDVPGWLNSTRQFISDAATTPREAGGIVGGMLDAGYGMAAPLARMVGAGETADDLQRQRAILAQERADRLGRAEMSAPREWFNRNIPGAASSITQMATMAPAGFPGMVAGFAGTTADQSYSEGKESGLGQLDAAGYAVRQGVAEAAPMLAFEGLGKFIPGMQGVESRFANALTGAGGEAVKQTMRQQAVGALKGLGGELLEENLTSALQSENTARSVPGRQSENDYVGPDGSFFTSPMAKTFADTTGQTLLTMGLAETPTMAERARQMFDPAVQRYLKTPSRDNYKALPPEIKQQIVPGSDGTEEPNRAVRSEGRKKLEELRKKLEEEAAGAGLDPTETATPVEITPPAEPVDQPVSQGEASSFAPAEPVGVSEPVAVHQAPIQVGDGNEAIRDVNEGRQGTEEAQGRQGRLQGLLEDAGDPLATGSSPLESQAGVEGSALPSIAPYQSAMPVPATQDQGLAPSISAPAMESSAAPLPSSFEPAKQAAPESLPVEQPQQSPSPDNPEMQALLARMQAQQEKALAKQAKRQADDAKLAKLNEPVQQPQSPVVTDPRSQFESLPDGVKFTINHHIEKLANAAQSAADAAKKMGDRYGWEVAGKQAPAVQESIRRLGEVAQKIKENTSFDPQQVLAAAGMPDMTEFNRLANWGSETATKPSVATAAPVQQQSSAETAPTQQQAVPAPAPQFAKGDTVIYRGEPWKIHDTSSPDGLVAITRKQGFKKRQVDRVEPQKLSLLPNEAQEPLAPVEPIAEPVAAQPESPKKRLGKKAPKEKSLLSEIQSRGGISKESFSRDYNIREDAIQNGLMGLFQKRVKTDGGKSYLDKGGQPFDVMADGLIRSGIIPPAPSDMNPSDWLLHLLKTKSPTNLHVTPEAEYEASYRQHLQELEDAKRAAAELGADPESISQSEESGIQQADDREIDDFIPQEERASQDRQATAQESQSANEPASHEDRLEYYRQLGYDLENEADWQRYIDDHGAPPDLGQGEMSADEDPFASSEPEPQPPKAVGPAGITKSEAYQKASRSAGKSPHDQAVAATWAYLGQSPSEWSAVPVVGSSLTANEKGEMVAMPEFDFPSGYRAVETVHESSVSNPACQLCGHSIKNAFFIQNDSRKQTMAVGSECVTNFGTGQSGEQLAKKALQEINRSLVEKGHDLLEQLDDEYGSRRTGARKEDPPYVFQDSPYWKLVERSAKTGGFKVGEREDAVAFSNRVKVVSSTLRDILFNTSNAAIVAGKPRRNRHTNHKFKDPASDAVITRLVNQRGDELRSAISEAESLLRDPAMGAASQPTTAAKQPWEKTLEEHAGSKPAPFSVNLEMSPHQAAFASDRALKDHAKGKADQRRKESDQYHSKVAEWENSVRDAVESKKLVPSQQFAGEEFDADAYSIVADVYEKAGIEMPSPFKLRRMPSDERQALLRQADAAYATRKRHQTAAANEQDAGVGTPASSGQAGASPSRESDYFKGDRVEFTGKTTPDGFREFQFMEGHRKGEFGVMPTTAQKDARAERNQAEWKDQQAQFARLHDTAPAVAAPGTIGVDGTQKTLFNKEPQGKLFNMEAPKKGKPSGTPVTGPSLLEQIDDEQKARSKASAPLQGQKALAESPARFIKTVAPIPNQRFSIAAYGKNGVIEYYEIQSSALKDSPSFNTEEEAIVARDKLEAESRAKYSNQEYDKKFMSLGGLVQEDRARSDASSSSEPGNLNRQASGFRRADVGRSPKQQEPSPYENSPVAVPLALPELVELAESTTGQRPQMGHKLRSALGHFKAMEGTWESKIAVRPELAHDNDGNGGEQMLRTLSHEIGHSIDFNAKDEEPSVPNTMARGNILGRIGSMARYLKHTLTSSPDATAGEPLSPKDRKALRRAAVREAGKDATPEQITAIYQDMVRDEMEKRDLLHVKDVTDELKALTRWWKPFDEDLVEKSYLRYRDSSEELFADAMSVLLNAPSELAERAPIFYHAMEEYLLRKPEVGQELFRLWDLSQQTPDQIAAHRGARIVEGFQNGADAFKNAWEARHPEVSLKDKLVYALQEGLPALAVDKYTGLKKRARAVNDKAGEYLIDELFQKDAPQYLLAMETSNQIVKPLAEAGINDDIIGKYLLAYRIVNEETIPAKLDDNGIEITPTLYGRKDLANPNGMTYEASQEMLDAMRRELGEEKFNLLDSKMREWHRDILWPVIEDAFKSGVYSESNRERLEKNKDAYAAFAVAKYVTDNMSPMLRQQVGTFDDVGNPFHFTTLKMLSLIRLNQLNTAKRYVANELLPQSGEVFPVDVPHGQFHPKGQPRHGYEFFHLLEDGKVTWREVPAFVASSFEKNDTSVLHRMGRALSSATYKVFHPLYVTFSPGFLMANPFRDLMRTYRNLGAKHGVSFRDVFREWWKAIPEARRYAVTGFSDSVEKLIEHKAFSISFSDLTGAKSEVVPFLPDIKESQSPIERWIEDGKNPLTKFMRSLKRIGEIQEVATKIAADRLLEQSGVTDPQERAYSVRKYAGTPDWKQSGEITDISNSLFLYSRVKWNALQADAQIAFDKNTAAGFWMRQALISMLPTTLMKAGLYGGLAGLFGDDLEKLLKAIPKYLRDNYLVIPMPWNRGTAEHPKTDFITIPRDENSQFMAKLWGHFLDAGAEIAGVETQEASAESATQSAIRTTSEGLGGAWNPAIQVALAWLTYASGSNPTDSHSQEPIIPKSTYEAGGMAATKKILQWSWDKTGALSQMTRFASGQIWGSPYEDREEPWFESLAMGAGQMTGLSKLIHTGADRGLQEFDWTQVEREKQRKAAERLDRTTPAIRRLNTELSKLSGMGELNETQWLRKRTLSLWQSRHYDRVMDEVKHIGPEGSQQLVDKLDQQARSLIDADSQMPDEFLPSILMQATDSDDGKNSHDIAMARKVATSRGLTKQQAMRMLFAESRRVAQLRENAAAKKMNRKPRVMPQPEMSDAMAKRIRALKFLN